MCSPYRSRPERTWKTSTLSLFWQPWSTWSRSRAYRRWQCLRRTIQTDLSNNFFVIFTTFFYKILLCTSGVYLHYHRSQQQNEIYNQAPLQSWLQPRAQHLHPKETRDCLVAVECSVISADHAQNKRLHSTENSPIQSVPFNNTVLVYWESIANNNVGDTFSSLVKW